MTRRVAVSAAVLLLGAALGANASPVRTLLSRDGRLPGARQAETGFTAEYRDLETADRSAFAPYLRYGLYAPVAVYAALPFVTFDSDRNGDDSGIGDATVGLEAMPYRDSIDNWWILAHAQSTLPTGDEDAGLGAGDPVVTVGVAVGAIYAEEYHLILDGTYTVSDTASSPLQPDDEDYAAIAGAVVWDVGPDFALLAEVQATDEEAEDGGTPITLLGGMVWHAAPKWTFMAYGGQSEKKGDEIIGAFKTAYEF